MRFLSDLLSSRGDGAGGIEGPADFFEIADEFFAVGIDEEAVVAGLVAEAAVDGS